MAAQALCPEAGLVPELVDDLLDALHGRLCHAVPAIYHLGYGCHRDAGRTGHVRHLDTLRKRHADDDKGPGAPRDRGVENVIDNG
ncbi:hypothetical protein GCM10022225_03850 [Plantactinospora mayteni]|uniref:Uncharacterized protein n=1 Tax=Plantactinospora mayteni TaxID=566021 RepID=A0ABQ4EQH0_9ACTN|nr:hypothetical protein Pma05_34470 [Plantactinospora mayteni]